jgi:hypothetical protein
MSVFGVLPVRRTGAPIEAGVRVVHRGQRATVKQRCGKPAGGWAIHLDGTNVLLYVTEQEMRVIA